MFVSPVCFAFASQFVLRVLFLSPVSGARLLLLDLLYKVVGGGGVRTCRSNLVGYCYCLFHKAVSGCGVHVDQVTGVASTLFPFAYLIT